LCPPRVAMARCSSTACPAARRPRRMPRRT
jgi:hypothetical protein